MRENVIEWINGDDVATVTLSQGRYISKVRKLAEKFDEVKIVAENQDGSIVAKLPLKLIRIAQPRQMSEEQKQQARERMKQYHKTNQYYAEDHLSY